MSLIQQYEVAIAQGEINNSFEQRNVVLALDTITKKLQEKTWFLPWRKPLIHGLYIYGPVGVGKTYVLDLFYQNLPDTHKARFHFHHFMQMVDGELRRLQGQKNPLRHIARAITRSIRVLCLDEFLVHDVADAMILADLLQQLILHDVILVATANLRPDDLYLDGVHRERFLPAITLINQHCDVMVIDDAQDHRLGRASELDAYLTPLNTYARETLDKQFKALAQIVTERGSITIQKREIDYVKMAGGAIWFEFNVICNLPRSQLDYLEIAARFDTIFLSNIPVIAADDTTHAILLINFVDVLYDRGVRLIVSAAAAPEALYVEGPMRISFQRTESRLKEMKSADYLVRHKKRDSHSWAFGLRRM
jgi:cell division protein ZapE